MHMAGQDAAIVGGERPQVGNDRIGLLRHLHLGVAAVKVGKLPGKRGRVLALLQQGRGRCGEAAFAWDLACGAGGLGRDELRARLAELMGCVEAR